MNQKNNTGVLFINDRKRPERYDPDTTGKALVGGKEYYVSGWTKVPKNNDKSKRYQSLSFIPVQQNTQPGQPQPDVEDDLPF